ncbi:hypothetical protein SteCoe_25061 [Stentor coeruleus]|uniref:Bromo domain-containing protein n=1 Tax=Stentor coeruleus TaxID=5963 RepID=A0A1R2BG72_9CILI|nr:hypothetical protein SteCoe_25061 [Stentor coeruleus]
MELFPTHVTMLNTLLPSRYKIELISKNDSCPVTSEVKNLGFDVRLQSKVPEKKAAKDLKPDAKKDLEPEVQRNDEVKTLLKIISEMKKNPYIAPFLHPVNKKEYPDYYEKITEPMDLSTIENKLLCGEYISSHQFAHDMRLIWNNSFFYNAKNSHLYSLTLELSMQFERLIKGKETLSLQNKPIQKPIQIAKESLIKEKNLQNDKPLGFMEKKLLCENIKKLEPKYLKGVLNIVKGCTNIKGEELEFDIDKLPPRICRDLDKYTKNCLQNLKKNQVSKCLENNEVHKPSQNMVVEKTKEPEVLIEEIKSLSNEIYRPDYSLLSSSTSESEEEIPFSNINDEMPMSNLMDSSCFPGYDSMIDNYKFY